MRAEDCVSTIARWRHTILFFWVAFACGFGYFAPTLMQHTSIVEDAPRGSPAAAANERLKQTFPQLAHTSTFAVLIESTRTERVVDVPGVKEISDALAGGALNRSATLGVLGYFPLMERGLGPRARAPFVSADGLATILEIEVGVFMESDAANAYLDWLSAAVKRLSSEHAAAGLRLASVSATSIIREAAAVGTSDLDRMDAIVLPLAFVILGFTLRSRRLLLVAAATMGVSFAGAFGILALIAHVTAVSSIAPSLMMSVLVLVRR